MTDRIDQRLRAIDARDFEARVGTAMRRGSGAVTMTEHDPMIIMTAFNDLLLLFLLTELPQADDRELRRQAFRFFRLRMDAMLEKRRIAHALLGAENDD